MRETQVFRYLKEIIKKKKLELCSILFCREFFSFYIFKQQDLREIAVERRRDHSFFAAEIVMV